MRRLYLASNYKINAFHLNSISKKWLFGYCFLTLLLLPGLLFAEGSKELNSNGGYRAYLHSSPNSTASFPYPTLGTMKVYVKAGETLYLGSSAQGVSNGTINLRAPDGSTYTSGSSKTVGHIANRSQEIAGPSPNTAGYTPYTRVVTAAQEGVWEIDFLPPSTNDSGELLPISLPAASAWSQPPGPYIAAFDISVRNTANSAFLTGRAFTNVFSGILGSFNVGFNGIFHILTRDGYQYVLDNNGQAGDGFCFFANNKGFKKADGTAGYQSVNDINDPSIQDPRIADTQSDVTHKIFFNTPANDLPAGANTPGGGTTWLINPPFIPSVSAFTVTGTEGTVGKMGTAPLGGTINFTATANGLYTIFIDVNKNGIFSEPIDRVISGVSTVGLNSIKWDGLDGLGKKVPASSTNYNANITLTMYVAEVHFPFFDVERNVNGIKLTRTTGSNSPDNTVYWDDSQIIVDSGSTPSSPIKNLTGINSTINGHKWGTTTTVNDPGDFGDQKGIDTWAYVSSAPVNTSISFLVQEANLEVVSLKSDVTTGCVGQVVNYTAIVKNNGPTNVTGATFAFTFPKELTGIKAASIATTGATTITSVDTTQAGNYKAIMDMPNGSVRTFIISGTVTGTPTGTLDVTASILRTADVTDPDATNPDSATPTDPSGECDSAPSGIGCNNIKTVSNSFLPIPDAGPDQSVDKNIVATLRANTAGTWSQVGVIPSKATIANPTSAQTTVSGLTTIGPYTFVYTNANGCADTVVVNVSSPVLGGNNVITPNGDDKNDTFVIPDLDFYPGSKLSIYNRWGNEVYHSDNYKNDWDGKGLADGTYYYLFERKDPAGKIKIFKDWIYLKR